MEIYIKEKIFDTKKATKFSLKKQVINNYKVKAGTEVWIPNQCYTDQLRYSLGIIEVKDEFAKKLIFIY